MGSSERWEGRTWREAVDEGSKPRVEGALRALRFCMILSSTVERERRRKSDLIELD